MLATLLKKLNFIFRLREIRRYWGLESKKIDNSYSKKSGENQPDLDKLWQKFNQRMNYLLGIMKSSSGHQSGGDPGLRTKNIIITIVSISLISVWLLSGLFTVKIGQTGVVTTLGEYSYSAMPGFNWCWPYPIQNREIINVSRIRTMKIGNDTNFNVTTGQHKETLIITADEKIIHTSFKVCYVLKNAKDWVFNVLNPEKTIRQVAETSIREVIGKENMDSALYTGQEKIALNTKYAMQKILDLYKMGVQITDVVIECIQPPRQVKSAFDDEIKAFQDYSLQKKKADSYANYVIPRAQAAASRLLLEADAYSVHAIADAEADTSYFKQVLQEYQKAPTVTRYRMYLDTMKKIFENTSKVMLDTKNKNNIVSFSLDGLYFESAKPSLQKDTVIDRKVNDEILKKEKSDGLSKERKYLLKSRRSRDNRFSRNRRER